MKHLYTHLEKISGKELKRKSLGGIRLLLPVLVFSLCLIGMSVSGQICCPQFKLQDAVEICPPDGACQGGASTGGVQKHPMVACKLINHQYTVYPNDPAFTYTWSITGGTPAFPTGNPVNIVWGTGAMGHIKIIISNIGTGGVCLDSISEDICLIDGPKANFNLSPSPVCSNIPVHFTNTSSGGSNYLWDFGDGTTSTLASPPDHIYTIPNTYTVTLTATNAGPASPQPDGRPPCGCTDKITKTVVVLNGSGPKIDLDCCFGTVCAGDTSSFCTSVICGTYNWSAAGGVIVSGLGTNCIKVKWNAVYTVPTTVSLATPGCLAAPCAGTTTLNVPVLYPNLPISGPLTLCVGASGSYFLPSMPGTYYLWTTTAAPGDYAFNDKNKNTPNINISYSVPGTYQLQCQYNNPMAGCSGISVITINVLPVLSISGDETVCQGSPVLYSVTSGNATWAVTPAGATVPPGPANTSTITWNTPGTFTITATTTTTGVFCNPSAIKVVQVIAKPILNNILGPVLVCPGKQFGYSISSNTQGSPYVWAVTSGTGTVVSLYGADQDSAIIKLTGTGPSWTISVYQKIEITPGNYCQSLIKTLVVNAYGPPTVTGNTNVCVDAVEPYIASGPTPPGGFSWSVIPSSQGSVILGQGTNTVNIRWHGTPATATVVATSCGGTGTKPVTILNPPFVGPITANGALGYCYPAMPNNLTLSVTPGFLSYQWNQGPGNTPIFGATTFSYSIPNATFTGMGVYYFSVDVSNGTCAVRKNIYIVIDTCGSGSGGVPPNPITCSVDFTINPNPACQGQPVTFTAIPTGPGFSFAWDFGDGATSFQSPTQHTYVSTGTDTVTLTATIGTCVAVKKKVVTVNPTPNCLITAPDTIFCPGGYVTLYGCGGMSSYQWYRDGSPISGETSVNCNASKVGEYMLEVSNSYGCTNTSNSIFIYKHSPPKAKITGDGSVCAYPNNYTSFLLSAYLDPNYSYSWSSNAGGVTFSPNNSNSANNTMVSLTTPAVLPATFYFVVKVTDTVTTCVARDTLCVTFFETPTITIPYTAVCEGGPVTFTPAGVDTVKYHYHWSSGQTTPSITVHAPGSYSVTIIDKVNGCSATAVAGAIYPKPDLSLFPHGCRTIICKKDTLKLYIPLPLSFYPPFNTYANAYQSITWYDNGNYGTPIASGQNFNFIPTAGGSHQISVVVATNHGCTDTARVFCVTVLCGEIHFEHCPSGPITLACNATPPTNADALAAVGNITSTCPGPVNVVVTGGVPAPLTGCTWTSTFTITATDACGGILVCSVTFNWKQDTEPPHFTKCPSGPITLSCNSPHPTNADALSVVGTVLDNCPGAINVVVTGGAATPSTGCDWTATFTITATDDCGNVAVCYVVYNWKEDTTPPQFAHCPTGPILLSCNSPHPVSGEVLQEFGGVTDNCPGAVNVQINGGVTTPTTGCNWTSVFTITAKDACGNTNVCYVTYIWKEDHTAPVFAHCPAGPISLPCNSPHPTEADALAAAGPVTDDCLGVMIHLSGGVPTPSTGCYWTSVFTITASDSCGNSSSCTITYNWKEDTTPPQFAHCPQGPINLPCNSHPIAGEILYEIGPITDNCPGHIDVQVTGGVPTPTASCSWTSIYTITATDSCGNVNVCTVTYNWKVDHNAPVFAHCPAGPISLPCNSPRPTEADALLLVGSVTDSCSGTVTVGVTNTGVTETGSCGWTETFTITATDACGNQAGCQVTYNWKEDHTPPVFAHCPVRAITLPCNSPRPTTNQAVDAAGPVTDNCYIENINVTDGGVIATIGCWFTETFTLTAVDGCGNVATCHVTYNWREDHTAPEFAHCPANPIELPCNAPRPTNAGALASAGAVTDNCPGNVFVVNCLPPTDGHYDSPTLVSYGTDVAIRNFALANWSPCNPPPTAIGQSDIHTYASTASFELSEDGGTSWIPAQSPAEITIKITKTGETETEEFFDTEMLALNLSGGTLPQGVQIRESPTKASTGETRIQANTGEFLISSFFDVFTEISIDPAQGYVAAIQPININLSGPIIVHVNPGSITPLAGCALTQTFTLTATDACGNTSNCQVTYIWTEDHTPPVFAHCPEAAITLPCNSPRPTTNIAVDAAGPVTDNCYIENINVTDGGVIATNDCGFTETFTLTAIDGCGNTAVCHVTYNWKVDHTPPVFAHCSEVPVLLPCNSSPTTNDALAQAGTVTDNCGSVVVTVQEFPKFSIGGCGWRKIFVITATDDCGNTSLCNVKFDWTEDHYAPTFTRPSDIVILADASGHYNASVSVTGDVTNEWDNCSTGLNATYTDVVFPGPFPYFKTILRTWSLVDLCGNAADNQVQAIHVAFHSGGKKLTLSLLLEGLYNGSGTMRKVQDKFGDHFASDTADIITVELHRANDYAVVEYVSDNVKLSTNGLAELSLPADFQESYWVTVRHRNSIETTSSAPVSFSETFITCSFTNPATVFGRNLVLFIDGTYAIYGGDVNQDGIDDGSDLSSVDNHAAAFSSGYIPEDCNGDGIVDGSDMAIVDNNASYFIGFATP